MAKTIAITANMRKAWTELAELVVLPVAPVFPVFPVAPPVDEAQFGGLTMQF